MEILLIFQEKSRTASKETAIKIAEKNECIKDGSNYKVIFHEVTPDLIKLLKLSRNWPTTEFFIDGKETNLSTFLSNLLCYNKNTCKGICEKVRIGSFYSLSRLIEAIKSAEKGEYWNPERLKMSLEGGEILKKQSDDAYFIDKEGLKKEILGQLEFPLKFCDKIKKDLILKQIDTLPSTFKTPLRKEILLGASIDSDDSEDTPIEREFEGFTDYELAEIKAKAEIEAPILAKALANELKKLLKS
jgi:hypothetical protein